MKNKEETIIATIDKIRSEAEDIVEIVSFGIKPMFDLKDNEAYYELSSGKLDELLKELFEAKENLNKSFAALKRKI